MEIEVYLIRHGIAAERGTYRNDGDRPLTDEGRAKTQRIAQQLLAFELQFGLILTSPLVRARQTAAILQEVGLSQQVEEADYLAPAGDIQSWLDWLPSWSRSHPSHLALVGHEPDLSEWTERLIWGEPSGNLRLKKGGIIGLTLPQTGSPIGNSTLFWLTPPRLLLKE